MREPDLYIGGKENPYLLRWRLLPKNKYPINIYLHKMLRDDDDRGLHDHPWPFITFILWGGYIEVQPAPEWRHLWKLARHNDTGAAWTAFYRRHIEKVRRPLSILYRPKHWPHRLKLRGKCSWSLVITFRPVQRWGFYTKRGWIDSRYFTRTTDKSSTYIEEGMN